MANSKETLKEICVKTLEILKSNLDKGSDEEKAATAKYIADNIENIEKVLEMAKKLGA